MFSAAAVIAHLERLAARPVPSPSRRWVDDLDGSLRALHARLAEIDTRRDDVFSPVARRLLGIEDDL